MLVISAAGIKFIEDQEGFSSRIYKDIAGKDTIGYGHKIQMNESFPQGVTEEEGRVLLDKDLCTAEYVVNKENEERGLNLTQGQFDALVSFTFNLGGSRLKQLLDHGKDQVPFQILRWHFAGDKDSIDLQHRRAGELVMWNS